MAKRQLSKRISQIPSIEEKKKFIEQTIRCQLSKIQKKEIPNHNISHELTINLENFKKLPTISSPQLLENSTSLCINEFGQNKFYTIHNPSSQLEKFNLSCKNAQKIANTSELSDTQNIYFINGLYAQAGCEIIHYATQNISTEITHNSEIIQTTNISSENSYTPPETKYDIAKKQCILIKKFEKFVHNAYMFSLHIKPKPSKIYESDSVSDISHASITSGFLTKSDKDIEKLYTQFQEYVEQNTQALNTLSHDMNFLGEQFLTFKKAVMLLVQDLQERIHKNEIHLEEYDVSDILTLDLKNFVTFDVFKGLKLLKKVLTKKSHREEKRHKDIRDYLAECAEKEIISGKHPLFSSEQESRIQKIAQEEIKKVQKSTHKKTGTFFHTSGNSDIGIGPY